jgi:hypothetical protein
MRSTRKITLEVKQEMAKKVMRILVLTIIVMGGAIFATSGVASADSIGQCNLHPGNTMTSVSDWQHTLSEEDVINQTKTKEIFKWAGLNPVDQSVGQWVKERVMLGKVVRPFSGKDYGCRDGKVFSAGHTSYAAGKEVLFVLSKKYAKSEVSIHRTTTFSKAVKLWVKITGLGNCANAYEGEGWVVIYVRAHNKPKSHIKVTETPAVSVSCKAGEVVASNGSCVTQTNTSTQTCGNSQVKSSTECLTIQINNNCGEVAVGSTITQGGENCQTNIEVKEEPKCANGETGTYPHCEKPSEPKCAEGETGTYPHCEKPKCPEGYKGTYPHCEKPSEPKCANGETGTYPHCEKPSEPKCAEGETGTYPHCEKPKCPEGYKGTYPHCEKPSEPKCAEGETGTYPHCEKPKPQPPNVKNQYKIQEVYISEPGKPRTILGCATATGPIGDPLVVIFYAEYGKFQGKEAFPDAEYGANGYCQYYESPTSVPPGGHDFYSVFVQDTKTGLTAEVGPSEFEVLNPEEEHGGFH